jgi:WD40 repeat protein
LQFSSGLSQAVFSPSGEALAVALGSGDVVERRLSDGRELRRWHWADGVAKCVTYSRDDRLFGAAMGAAGQLLGPAGQVRTIESPHKLRRAGRHADGRLWALTYTDETLLIHPEDGAVDSLMAGPVPFDGSSSPDTGTAAILDARGGVWALELPPSGEGPRPNEPAVAATWREVRRVPDAVAVDVGNGGGPIVVAVRRSVCVDAEHCADIADDIVDVAWSGKHLAVATAAGDVWLLSSERLEVKAVLPGHTGRVSSVEFSPDGQSLVSAGWDGTARIWDLRELDVAAETLIARSERVWGLGLEEAMRGL